jgi:hypothetical protein
MYRKYRMYRKCLGLALPVDRWKSVNASQPDAKAIVKVSDYITLFSFHGSVLTHNRRACAYYTAKLAYCHGNAAIPGHMI